MPGKLTYKIGKSSLYYCLSQPALGFGCLILVTETVKRADNGVKQSLNLLCDIMKMGNVAG